MKAVTLYQPWATLISIGAKRIETRSWSTNFRGLLAIHAGTERKYITKRSKYYICDNDPFLWFNNVQMPTGVIIAICELKDCLLIKNWPSWVSLGRVRIGKVFIPSQERAFGDYTPGRFMWFLENVRELKHPIPAKGALSLWEWTPPGALEFK